MGSIDLTSNNYELLRAATTAMDQSYGAVDIGFNLQTIDNSGGEGKIQPFQVPSGWKLVKVVEDDSWGGRVVVYKHAATNTVIRRECLDHLIVLNENHLRRGLGDDPIYVHGSRTPLGLYKDCPNPRPVQPTDAGKVIAIPYLGGLHHQYLRKAS